MHRPFRFSAPSSGPTTVLRPRLLRLLNRRFEVRLLTIEAGAGLGKTTLLAHAVSENRLARAGRDCWVTCEPADSSASTLLGALLQATGGPDAGDQPSVEQVCEAVWSSTPEQVCLVLDDAHHIEPESPGEATLVQLLEGLPENGHLVVAGRRLPALPRTRLVLQDRAVELVEDDLRLDDAETAALAASHGVAFDVVRAARGWPALAELHARTGLVRAERFVWEEVLSALPERDREAFLLLVAVGGTDADTLDAVVGGGFDRGALSRLPLVASDEHGGLRPHPLWEELLHTRIDPAGASEARRRLATALLERGDNGTAFELLAASGDWDHALPALFAACNDQRHPPWGDQMERWRRLLPPDRAAAPEAVYLDAMIDRAGDAWSDAANASFARAVEAFRVRGDIVREVTAGVRWSHLAWLRCDRSTLEAVHVRGRELEAAGVPLQVAMALNRAIMADVDGRSADVLHHLAPIGNDTEPRLRHYAPTLRVFARLAEGDADAAVPDAADALAAAIPVMPAGATGWAGLAPAAVAWARGDLGAVLADPPGDPGGRYPLSERVPAIALGAVVAAHLGDAPRALALVDDIDALVPELGERHLLAGFRAVAAAAAAVAAGDEDGARGALCEALEGRPLDPAGAGRAVRWMPSVPYLFHDGARSLLDSLPCGPSRERTLAACRALLYARAGRTVLPRAVLDDPAALVAALPAALAAELVARTAIGARPGAHETCSTALAQIAPRAVRDALRRLAEAADPEIRSAARSLLAAVPIPPPERIRIEVLGPARLLRDGQVVDEPDWRRQRVRQLVCALVASREIRRARLGALLWPEFDEKGVSANLRMTLSYVQALLEPHRAQGDAPWFLRQESGVLRLRADEHFSVDAWEFEAALDAAAAAAAAGTPSLELRHLLEAVALWRGDYLDDVAGEEWAEPPRERARQQLVRAAVRGGDLLVAAGRFAEAAGQADVALRADPWCEPALRLRVAAHLGAGDRTGARHAYEAGLRALADLGVSPEPATEQLGARLRDTTG